MLFLGIFVVIFLFSFASAEPSCSKYHYEEQILERVIKTEFYMQDFQKQFERLVDKVTSEVTSLKDDMDAMRRDWKVFNEQTTQSVSSAIKDLETRQETMETNVTTGLQTLDDSRRNLVEQMSAMKGEVMTPQVSFRARAPADMTPTRGDTIIYQTAGENLGGGYDTSTGVFTAPVPGVYIFSVNICSQNKDAIYISIIKDDTPLVGTSVADSVYYYCSTLFSYAVLGKGGKVWVGCTNPGVFTDNGNLYWNSFSGLLVHK